MRFVLEVVGVPEGAVVAALDNVFRFSLLPTRQRFLQSRTNLVVAMPEKDKQKLRRTGVLELSPDDRVLHFHE